MYAVTFGTIINPCLLLTCPLCLHPPLLLVVVNWSSVWHWPEDAVHLINCGLVILCVLIDRALLSVNCFDDGKNDVFAV